MGWDGRGTRREHNISSTESGLPDDLRTVLDAWDDLPAGVRQGIVETVKALAKGSHDTHA